MQKAILLTIFIYLSINSFSQSYWRIENERGEELLLTIHQNSENLTFEAYSRKDALREMAGTILYMMAKTAGKIKYPELMHGDGKINYKADTTFYDGIIHYPDKIFSLKAKSWKNQFSGVLTDPRNRSTVLNGEKLDSDAPIRDYSALISAALSLVEKYYWNSNLSKISEWQDFKQEVGRLGPKIADDYEMAMTLMWLGKKLNNIPHEIRKYNKKTAEPPQKSNITFKILDKKVAWVNLNNLPSKKDEIDLIFMDLEKNGVEKLILDASGARNLSLQSALCLANHLFTQPTNWGLFLTSKWMETEKIMPAQLWSSRYSDPEQLLRNEKPDNSIKGYYLRTTPVTPCYKKKIYLIVNKWSTNVAEALTILLKNEKAATIVGQKTGGSPQLNLPFEISNGYRINIPIARFADKEGKLYNGIGIEPDVVVEQNPVDYVMKL